MKSNFASGKFVLRTPSELHARLQREAQRQGLSLNNLCLDLIGAGLRSKGVVCGEPNLPQKLHQSILQQWKDKLIGIVLFGSSARGDASPSSDIDLFLILKSNIKIQRKLYHEWSDLLEPAGLSHSDIYSPHFVLLPKDIQEAGSLWFEIALDGIVLWEKNYRISSFLRKLRTAIAEGNIKRKLTHGHPYWQRAVEGPL